MSAQEITLLIVIAAAIVVILLVWLFMRRHRTQSLRDAFGQEYDRTVEARGKRGEAEADLIERRERVSKFTIRPLTAEERDGFAASWNETKALFVDSPVEAVSRADRLLAKIMDTRGFPMSDFEHRHADLTVEHGEAARHYLAGHEIAARSNDATTEELRRAINHYEALYSDMTNKVTERNTEGETIPDDEVDVTERTAPTKPAAFSTTTRRVGD